jgi:hypothetical protein
VKLLTLSLACLPLLLLPLLLLLLPGHHSGG